MALPSKTFIFAVDSLGNYRGRNPGIMRKVEVREDTSLYDLAEVVNAFGFDFDHAFGFFSRVGDDYHRSEKKYELFADMDDVAAEHPNSLSVERTKVSEVWRVLGESMMLLFDYGDMWRFAVNLAGFGVAEPTRKYPRVLKSIGVAPDQYEPVEE